jgi:iron complex outermembrane recepter protein
MKNAIILCALVLIFYVTDAQNQITGKITDHNNLPLAGATVLLPEINKGTLTDTNGNYKLNSLPNGEIRIQYSFIGYSNVIKTVFLSGAKIELNITLKEAPFEAEEVIISGGYNSTQHENAVKIEVLKLDQHTNLSSPNFTEILTKVPGIEMISKGNGVSKPVIRGLSKDNVLVLNNGVRFENYQYSDHHPLGIDEFGIEDVEIIKGPASLLYGADAIGGVINFIKEKNAPVGIIMGDYNLELFSNSLGMANNIGVKGSSKNFFGGLRLGQKTHADFIQGGGNYVPNSRFNEYNVKANAGFTNKNGVFKLNYDFNQQKLGLVEEEAVEKITARGRRNTIWYEQMNNHMLALQNKLFINKYKVELNAAYQYAGLTHFAGLDTTEIAMNLTTFTYEAKLNFPSTERSEYIIGFQGLNQINQNFKNAAIVLLPDAHTDNYSFFCLLQYTFFKKLRMQLGGRYDYKMISSEEVGDPLAFNYRAALNKRYGSFSGSFGATYNVTDELLFRVNFATAYRTPNLAELTSNGKHETRYELGNENLKPQNTYETDVSAHYHLKDITIDIAGFYNIINRLIFMNPTNDTTGAGDKIYKYIQSNAALFGGEAGISIHPGKCKWLIGEVNFSTVTGKRNDGSYLPFIPANKLQFEIIAEIKKLGFLRNAFVKVNSPTVFKQKHPSPEEETTSGYSLLNAGIGASIKAGNQLLSLAIGVNNIFDRKYIDHLSTLKEAGFYNPGRNITLSLKIPFGIK